MCLLCLLQYVRYGLRDNSTILKVFCSRRAAWLLITTAIAAESRIASFGHNGDGLDTLGLQPGPRLRAEYICKNLRDLQEVREVYFIGWKYSLFSAHGSAIACKHKKVFMFFFFFLHLLWYFMCLA